MKKIMFSAFILADAKKITGIQRVAREVILRLDKMIENTDVQMEYLCFENSPHSIIALDELKNIKPVMFKRRKINKANIYTNLFDLPRYIKKNAGLLVNLDLDFSTGNKYIACIPDIRPTLKGELDSFKFKIIFKHLILHFAKKNAKYIVTHSNYQRQRIIEYLKIKPERVKIIQHGYEHINNFCEDDKIFERFPALGGKKEKQYYYTLANIAPNKNFKWIYEVARRNPDKLFAVAGAVNQFGNAGEYLKQRNIIYLGRVTDCENKALMMHCKAFLFPSKYEGFGLPPLEALACGAPICISNATCLPEIYGDCAHYFNPDDYDVNLDKLLSEPVANPGKILTKYTWDNSVKAWFDLIMGVANDE